MQNTIGSNELNLSLGNLLISQIEFIISQFVDY
jgi:hypothetical protein